MGDIVERLRFEAQEWAAANARAQGLGKSQAAQNQCKVSAVLLHEAANEIDRLRAALTRIASGNFSGSGAAAQDIARNAFNNSN